jgi:hypothetical protein
MASLASRPLVRPALPCGGVAGAVALKTKNMKTKKTVKQLEKILFDTLRARADRHAAAWAARGFPAKRGSGPRVDRVTPDMVQDAQSEFFAASAPVALEIFRRAAACGWELNGALLRWVGNHPAVVRAGYKASGQWFRSLILRDSGRWVDAPDLEAGEAGEDDEDLTDLEAMKQIAAEFEGKISDHWAGLLRDVRRALQAMEQSIAARVAAARSGAAAAAVKRSGGSDLALLETLAGFLESGEPLPAMDWEKFVKPTGRGLSDTGRQVASRLKAKLASV